MVFMMADLFADINPNANAPLAEKMRPTSIDKVIGQAHLLAKNMPLERAFKTKSVHSMIFWGPPGVGKTSLARLCATAFDCAFISFSAVLAGVKEIREALEKAQLNLLQNKRTILFIDEIHRFNKSQQDALLPFVESGLITFIGATTENPSFEINRALLSRAQVYVLNSLSMLELELLLNRACSLFYPDLSIDCAALTLLSTYADGDARRALNLLEQVSEIALFEKNTEILSVELVQQSLTKSLRRFDKGGEYFYDQISALHKSVRGSDPDAALYWFCQMLENGVDPRYLARRIIRIAWEDIGLADPRALQIANDAATTFERLGTPEGELALAQAVIYLSVAAKSNAGYTAFNQARAFVKADKTRDVPLHLRNAPTGLMKKLGYGKSYRYAHNEPHAYAAAENYFPDDILAQKFYQPVDRGLEIKIAQKMEFLSTLDELAKSNKK
ncbi:recombination intermediate processing DNA-dependent ATPase [Gammaproteobacteria bacterium]|nr:recombination intermediate processing DNA-dependent ATPase [Gammaproteobacteria bacterium]